jgi:putative transposase
LADRADGWPWSSARAHLGGRDDGLVSVHPLLEAVGDWAALLDVAPDEARLALLRQHSRTGRPLGDTSFVANLEQELRRPLRVPASPAQEGGARPVDSLGYPRILRSNPGGVALPAP